MCVLRGLLQSVLVEVRVIIRWVVSRVGAMSCMSYCRRADLLISLEVGVNVCGIQGHVVVCLCGGTCHRT